MRYPATKGLKAKREQTANQTERLGKIQLELSELRLRDWRGGEAAVREAVISTGNAIHRALENLADADEKFAELVRLCESRDRIKKGK